MTPEKSEFVSRRLTKAKETLNEVDILIENKLWNTSVNRLYYACFYAVIASLHNDELNSKTHAGAQRLFNAHFVKTGVISKDHARFYSSLFEMRQDADYEDMVDYEKEEVIKLLQPAHDFIAAIEKILVGTKNNTEK